MDMALASMQMSLASTQSAVSVSILDKAMNRDVQTMATLLQDMAVATPAPVLATKAGSMDIRV